MRKIIMPALAAVLTLTGIQPAMAQRAGATRDQFLTRSEKQFTRLDSDKNGSLAAPELTAVFQTRANNTGKAFKPNMVTRLMKRNDSDQDGNVTLEEFKRTASAQFDLKDRNKNGTIDADEAGPSRNAGAEDGGE